MNTYKNSNKAHVPDGKKFGLKWSRTRKRYERQGLLVENSAVELAENECKALDS